MITLTALTDPRHRSGFYLALEFGDHGFGLQIQLKHRFPCPDNGVESRLVKPAASTSQPTATATAPATPTPRKPTTSATARTARMGTESSGPTNQLVSIGIDTVIPIPIPTTTTVAITVAVTGAVAVPGGR